MENFDTETLKKIYFIGIGGIGISAIARYLNFKGKDVLGSDIARSEITSSLEGYGIKVFYEQREENITDDIDLVIYTSAISDNNPELMAASKKGIKRITYNEALGTIFNGRFGISVCGTHGKSTTTAMAGVLLEDAKLDPSVLVGSIVPRYDGNLRVGQSEYFVAESCEYARNFLFLHPKIIILNNIELDHTDCYKDIDDIKGAFEEFIGHLPEHGVLIYNGDDLNVRQIVDRIKENTGLKMMSFGKNKNNDVYFQNFKLRDKKSEFEIFFQGEKLGKFFLKLPGEFNVYNASATIALGLHLDISTDIIRNSLENFSGIWRRFEVKGEFEGSPVISDYAHHPTAVKNTILAAKEFYPDKNIFVVFQPHQHNRTKKLYEEFLSSFSSADKILMVEIYDVAGREEETDQDVSAQILSEDLKKINKRIEDKIFYAENLVSAEKIIRGRIEPNDVILIMGAGDIYKVADSLVK